MPSDFMSYNDSLLQPRVVSITPNGGGGGGGMMGGSGMDPNLLNRLMGSFQQSQQQANKQNLNQYNSLMGTVGQTRQSVEGLLGQLGQTGMTQIGLNEKNQMGAMQQSMTSRGLGNTTIQDSSLRGVQNDAQLQRQQLQEGVAGQKIGAEMGLGQMQGDAILSRQNQQPDMSMYLNLIRSLSGGRI